MTKTTKRLNKIQKAAEARATSSIEAPTLSSQRAPLDVRTLSGIRDAARDTLEQLRMGALGVKAAQVEIRAINTLVSSAGIALEHARLTERLEKGSDLLPDVRLDPSAPSRGVIEVKEQRQLKAVH